MHRTDVMAPDHRREGEVEAGVADVGQVFPEIVLAACGIVLNGRCADDPQSLRQRLVAVSQGVRHAAREDQYGGADAHRPPASQRSNNWR